MPGQDGSLDPELPPGCLPQPPEGPQLDWQYFGDGEWAAESAKDVYTIRLIEGYYHLYVVKNKRIADLMKASS